MDDDIPEVLAACALAALYCRLHWPEFAGWVRARGHGEFTALSPAALAAAPRVITELLDSAELELMWRELDNGPGLA
jgi:hypothetical protein